MAIDPAAETARWLATLSPEDTARAVAYTQGGHWLILGSLVVSILAGWIIVKTNWLGAARDWIEKTKPRPKLASFVVAIVYGAMSFVLNL
ncbi:MAG: M48 family peptidase, partial [Brevundimonas sp.]